VVDEAHEYLDDGAAASRFLVPERPGHLLVSYRPAGLCHQIAEHLDAVVLLPGAGEPAPLVSAAASLLARAARGQVVMLEREAGGWAAARLVTLGKRRTNHVRHRHKYVSGLLPPPLRFHFRDDEDRLTGARAANIVELHRELARCEPSVIRHHARGGDLSRWTQDVLGDDELARRIAGVEAQVRADGSAEGLAAARRALLSAIVDRYIA